MNNPKYLVRPSDFFIFEVDESNGAYRSLDSRGTEHRPPAYPHFSYVNLTKGYGFFPIEEHEITYFQHMGNIRFQFTSWLLRSDGHGGVKGGTWEEFFKWNPSSFEEAMEVCAINGAKVIAQEEDEEILRKVVDKFDHHKTKLI